MNSIRMSERKQYEIVKGFSMAEVLLSVFILIVVIVPVIQALTKSMNGSVDSQSSIVASELAQEGVELVQNVRDNDFACRASGFASCSSDDGFRKFPGDRKYCRIDFDGNNTNATGAAGNYNVFLYDNANDGVNIQCSANGNNPADRYFDLQPNANGFYRITNNATEEKFKRRIVLDQNGSTYIVYSVVFWGGWSLTHSGSDTMADVIADLANCTLPNQCTYAQLELSAWK
jgi:Tfp pilus assembly protein PilV